MCVFPIGVNLTAEQNGIDSTSVSWVDSSASTGGYRITVDSSDLTRGTYTLAPPQHISKLAPGIHTIRLVILSQQPSQLEVAGQVDITVRSKCVFSKTS